MGRRGAVAAAAAARRAGLFLDLPLGVHPPGFDPWWEPDAFAHGISGGAPPDAFFAGGQDWAVPPLHPDHIREQEYRLPDRHLASRHGARDGARGSTT